MTGTERGLGSRKSKKHEHEQEAGIQFMKAPTHNLATTLSSYERLSKGKRGRIPCEVTG